MVHHVGIVIFNFKILRVDLNSKSSKALSNGVLLEPKIFSNFDLSYWVRYHKLLNSEILRDNLNSNKTKTLKSKILAVVIIIPILKWFDFAFVKIKNF